MSKNTRKKWYRIKEDGWYVIVSPDGEVKMYGWPTDESSKEMLKYMNSK